MNAQLDAHVPSQQELDLLFGPLYDDIFNAVSNPQDNQPTTNVQPTSAPSTPIYVYAEENNNDQAEGEHLQDDEFTNPFCALAHEVVYAMSNNALGYGAFLGIYANLRYQLLCGFDRAMVTQFDVIEVGLAFNTALRIMNAQLGETSVANDTLGLVP
nr:protein reticulata-related 1, chloroplastic [Tanacetum cinerariifolium]